MKTLRYWGLLFLAFASMKAEAEMQYIECELIPFDRKREEPQERTEAQQDARSTATYGMLGSRNWSGYLAQGTSATFVGGVWQVPRLSPSEGDAYSAIWVGMDGWSNDTVEQIGTAQDWIDGRQYNVAWFQMYPAPSYGIANFPLDVGDLITAKVSYIGKNIFRMVIINHTKEITAVIPYSMTTSSTPQRSSVEWIVEAPGIPTLPLAVFSPVTMKYCSATFNGVSGPINCPSWMGRPVEMRVFGRYIKATPTPLVSQGERFSSFKVNWVHE